MTMRDDDSTLDETMPPAVAAAVAQLPAPLPPSDLEVRRVMDAVRRRHRASRAFRGAGLAVGAVAASLLIGALLVARGGRAPAPVTAAGSTRPVVRFMLRAPLAKQLAVVGDFNSWDTHATPMTRDAATGAWEVSVTLPEGRYLYAFVADGKRWLADPDAPLASPDDFARQNSVLVVTPHTVSAAAQ
ncbi:MAG: isoamylase early set domain-containing protein [Gemmatimonadaceae bacterium]